MKKNGQPAGRQGFTLIEILVAATIIAVLSVSGVASYTSINKRSRDAKRKSDLEQVRSALEMFRVDKGYYPNSSGIWYTFSSVEAYVVPDYAPSVPTDPKSTAAKPVDYYYFSTGTGLKAYNYCLCAQMESEADSNTCGVGLANSGGTTPVSWCNYGLKNP